MAAHPALRQASAQVIAMSDNSQSAAPNTENTSRIGIPIATKRPCSTAWQCTFDAFWLQPAVNAGALCSGTRSAAQPAVAALRHEGKSPQKAVPPTPPLPRNTHPHRRRPQGKPSIINNMDKTTRVPMSKQNPSKNCSFARSPPTFDTLLSKN